MNDVGEWFVGLFRDHLNFWVTLAIGFLLGLEWLGYHGFNVVAQSIIIVLLSLGIGAVIAINIKQQGGKG